MFSRLRRRKHDRSSNHERLQDEVSTAEQTVENSKPPQPPRAEQEADTLEDHIQDLADDPYLHFLQGTSEVTLDLVKDQISDFLDNCELVKSLMDKLADLHPWLKVGIEVFKGVLNLELTRRANDQKVIALYVTMCDMMSTMKLLLNIADAKKEVEGETAECRLRKRMEDKDSGIITCIKNCGELCNNYNNRNLAVKIVTSPKWEIRFTRLAASFEGHKAGIQSDLQIYIATTINAVSADVVEIKQMVSVIGLAFQHLLSPEERDMKKFIATHGGMDAILGDETAVHQLLKMSSRDSEGDDEDSETDADLMTVDEFQLEIRKDIEVIIQENSRAFEKKFNLVLAELERVEDIVRRESDRTVEEVIRAMRSGPHGRIIDCDVYHVWTQNGWKASVKARYLVMALHDYFSQLAYATNSSGNTAHAHIHDTHQPRDAQPVVPTVASSEPPEPNGHSDTHRSQSASVVKDAWALQFINIFRVQQLIEAIDDDVSSFVTIEEINRFTAARPKEWSLPHWIAYSTIGVELAVNWYYRRIIRLLDKMGNASRNILPANRQIVNEFWGSGAIRFIDTILCGLHDPAAMNEIDWDHNRLFNRFRAYLNEREEAMKSTLEAVAFNIDDQTSLDLVTRGLQPEKYIMSLLCLLLRRALEIVRHASRGVIHELDLQVITHSVMTARRAVWRRVNMLKAVHKLQNLDPIHQREKFAYGLFTYIRRDKPPSAHFWTRQDCEYHLPEDDDPEVIEKDNEPSSFENKTKITPDADRSNHDSHTSTELQATYEISTIAVQPRFQTVVDTTAARDPTEDLETVVLKEVPHSAPVFLPMDEVNYVGDQTTFSSLDDYDHRGHSLTSPLIGQWRGPLNRGAMVFAFEVDLVGADGRFVTRDTSSTGSSFPPMKGVLDGRQATLRGTRQDGVAMVFEGQLHTSDNQLAGSWTMGSEAGTFNTLRVPPDADIFRPSEQEIVASPARARWTWAIKTVAHRRQLEQQRLQTDFIRHWRERRSQFLELATKWKNGSLNARDTETWHHILRTVNRRDLLYWELRWEYYERCTLIHQTIGCDNCRRTPITGGRNLCVECSAKDLINGTVEFCPPCVHTGAHSMSIPGHNSSHHLMQFRTVFHRRRLFFFYQMASQIIDIINGKSPNGDEVVAEVEMFRSLSRRKHSCVVCGDSVEVSFWYCLECKAPSVVCCRCNQDLEESKPWLFQRDLPPGDTHSWAHSLLLIPHNNANAVKKHPANRALLRVERRVDEDLSRLHERMDGLEKTVSDRLLRLETLIRSLVDKQQQSSM